MVDHAPNKTWIHVYNISLEYIPTLQDQEASMIREGLPPNHERPSSEVHDPSKPTTFPTPLKASISSNITPASLSIG